MMQAADLETPDDACRAFGEFLGLGEAVAPHVLRAALVDPAYARKLVGSRGSTAALSFLFERVPSIDESRAELSDATLVASAAKAIARWALGGMKRVDPAVQARRLDACRTCEHLEEAPRRALYEVFGGDDARACGLCGCVVAKKTSLPTEACPAMDAARPGFTRWGDRMA